MKKLLWIFVFLLAQLLPAISSAANIDAAITVYENAVEERENSMSWFIPFRSFCHNGTVNNLYACNNAWGCGTNCCGCGCGCEAHTKGWFFPIFYVAAPITHVALEVTATCTARVLGIPYLCYLAYKRDQANDMIDFLVEVKQYKQYQGNKDTKKVFYLNTKKLKGAFEKWRDHLLADRKVKVSEFITVVETSLSTNQFQANGNLWSIDDFTKASTKFMNDDGSFSLEEVPVDDPNETNCTICQNNKVTCAFLPCGHYVACDDCYGKFKKQECSSCRQAITGTKKIYQ